MDFVFQLPLELFQTPAKLQNSKHKNNDPSNYRTISLLRLISNFLERFRNDQTNELLKRKKLLYNYQSGFGTNHSNNLCLSFSTDKILKGLDEGLLTGMILIEILLKISKPWVSLTDALHSFSHIFLKGYSL